VSGAFNDGAVDAPRLRFDLNSATLAGLPPTSIAPAGSWSEIYAGVRGAGYEGLQHGSPVRRALEAGLRMSGMGRVDRPEDAEAVIAGQKLWADVTTLHVGSGLESDREMDALIGAVLDAAARHAHPTLVEIHRATVTQDMRRTLDLVERFPELRFNADLQHWYTGQEMTYGDFEAKLERLASVFARVRFFHGRIGDSCNSQVPAGESECVNHYRQMWTRCFRGFLADAAPGDVVIFAPELLANRLVHEGRVYRLNYARLLPDGSEETDRWAEALRLCAIARECFEAAGGRS
jgi:hypothetical protein